MAPSPAARSRLGFGNSDEHSADCYFPASSTQPDRFIPNRSALDLDIAHYNLVKENASSADLDLASEVASPSKVRRDRTRSEFPLSAIARDLVSRSKARASDA